MLKKYSKPIAACYWDSDKQIWLKKIAPVEKAEYLLNIVLKMEAEMHGLEDYKRRIKKNSQPLTFFWNSDLVRSTCFVQGIMDIIVNQILINLPTPREKTKYLLSIFLKMDLHETATRENFRNFIKLFKEYRLDKANKWNQCAETHGNFEQKMQRIVSNKNGERQITRSESEANSIATFSNKEVKPSYVESNAPRPGQHIVNNFKKLNNILSKMAILVGDF